MGRFEAALNRAARGEVAPAPALASTRPADLDTTETFSARAAADVAASSPGVTFNPLYAEKLVVSGELSPAVREQYRRVGATLHHAQQESGLKVLMVASAVSGEGKSLTATNIALTLSESYRRSVLLIDADLRRPSLNGIFGIPHVFGLNETLANAGRKASLVQVSERLTLLPAGCPNPDPMQALTSDRMKRLLTEAAASFDWVVIDTSPVAVLSDAKLLGAMVHGAILVVRAGSTPAPLIKRAVDALGHERILGVILNQAEGRHGDEGNPYYASYYYGARPQ